MSSESYWAVAQTVSKMEHIVRREIEKTERAAFLPTFARHWTVDGRRYVKEYPLLGGYVFFLTTEDDWAGIPDIHGVYDVLANPNRAPKRVTDDEMERLVRAHAFGTESITLPDRFTKYYRGPPPKAERRKSRKPRSSRRIRNYAAA